MFVPGSLPPQPPVLSPSPSPLQSPVSPRTCAETRMRCDRFPIPLAVPHESYMEKPDVLACRRSLSVKLFGAYKR